MDRILISKEGVEVVHVIEEILSIRICRLHSRCKIVRILIYFLHEGLKSVIAKMKFRKKVRAKIKRRNRAEHQIMSEFHLKAIIDLY